MSILTLTRGARHEVRPALALHDAFAALTNAWALRRARNEMSRLDDAMLHDIGVPRGDIDAAVRYGRTALRGSNV